MSNTNFTIGYNCILRDKSLSLTAKGLYLVISSYVGMPEWTLRKCELAKVSGTNYAMDKAWSELLAAGYLKHYTARAASGAFIHRYELMQEPSAAAPHTFVADADFVTGDCRIILSGESKRDFTRIPNAILRSKRIPLAVKGLFGVVAHLINIPDFSLNPAGVRSFCIERIKRFSSVWRQFKLSGLLKQHRYPTGEENSFEYQYELLDEPDHEAPYLVNHHADGSVSSERTISDYIAQASAKIKRLFGIDGSQPLRKRQKNAVRKSSHLAANKQSVSSDSRTAAIRTQIDADELSKFYAPLLVDTVVKALSDLSCAPVIKVKGKNIPQDERKTLVERVTYTDISGLLCQQNIDLLNKKHPVAYLRTVLYSYLTQQEKADEPSGEMPLWEQIWREQKAAIRKRMAEEAAQSTSEPQLSAWEQAHLNRVKEYLKNKHAEA